VHEKIYPNIDKLLSTTLFYSIFSEDSS